MDHDSPPLDPFAMPRLEDLPPFDMSLFEGSQPIPPPKVVSDEQHIRNRLLQPWTELTKAESLCYAGDVCAATTTINHILDKGTQPDELHYCLLAAILAGSESLVRVLLDNGVPIDSQNIKAAIRRKSSTMLSLFLHHGWDVNEQEDWCTPPLLEYAVAEVPDEPLIQWFLDNGADPNTTSQMDLTPLSTAVSFAPLAIVKQLFAHCPPDTFFQGQLLHWAAGRIADDAEDVVRLVLERCPPDINKIKYENDEFSFVMRRCAGLGTALHDAATSGHPSVVQMLLQMGADVSIRDSCGKTALEVAKAHGHHAAAELLQCAEKSPAAKM
ncbi:uncharacterized protein RCC_00976 [Ramularia collo-cygni]|uniref:Ankyrin n=1 Tax=Ramularia collo-cygni TaxID=112498 RepID=A0A2D3ULK6_9PEZI|nr:uncharacterized protein RCC_00976 [Ramularia collo-cygni]CZT15072.1 uncharacterized protein RCC_00976 [Ramularia collo-cygni]